MNDRIYILPVKPEGQAQGYILRRSLIFRSYGKNSQAKMRAVSRQLFHFSWSFPAQVSQVIFPHLETCPTCRPCSGLTTAQEDPQCGGGGLTCSRPKDRGIYSIQCCKDQSLYTALRTRKPNSINQYLIYNALVYNKSPSVKTVGLLNSQERGYYFRLVIVKSASEEVRLELCLEGR